MPVGWETFILFVRKERELKVFSVPCLLLSYSTTAGPEVSDQVIGLNEGFGHRQVKVTPVQPHGCVCAFHFNDIKLLSQAV